MCWYKSGRILLLFLLLAAASCAPETKNDKGQLSYFDIKKYFADEAARLSKKYPHITKTVSYNGQQETKEVAIKHWQQELNLFIESDINKPAWKNSYIIYKCDTGITYLNVDSTLHTRQLTVLLKKDKVTGIKVDNVTDNMLYQTTESLVYYPDSLYVIEKHQKVRLLGRNDYKRTGKFK